MQQNRRIILSLLRHDICAVLAHADIVSVSSDRENKLHIVIFYGKARRPQRQRPADFLPRKLRRTAPDVQNSARFGAVRFAEPLRRVFIEQNLRPDCSQRSFQRLRLHALHGLILRRPAILCRADRNQIQEPQTASAESVCPAETA